MSYAWTLLGELASVQWEKKRPYVISITARLPLVGNEHTHTKSEGLAKRENTAMTAKRKTRLRTRKGLGEADSLGVSLPGPIAIAKDT